MSAKQLTSLRPVTNRLVSLFALGLVLAGVLCLFAGRAFAESYTEDPVDEGLKRTAQPAVGAMGRDNKISDAQVFEKYFTNYYFPRWTVSANLQDLTAYRKALRNQLISLKDKNVVHEALVKQSLESLTKIVKGNYHPASRVNAMLAIGELNAKDVSGSESPTPSPEALAILLATIGDKDQLDAVKVAAWVGLARHAALPFEKAEAKKQVLDAALKRISESDESTPDKVWMRLQAAQTLGALRTAGENGAALHKLAELIGDEKSSLLSRTAAVEALSQIKYEESTGVKVDVLTDALRAFVRNVCDRELAEVKKSEPISRRRIKTCTDAALAALGGLGSAKSVSALQEPIKELSTAAEKEPSESQIEKIREKLK